MLKIVQESGTIVQAGAPLIEIGDPPQAWPQLEPDYRIIVHVTIWQADNVVTAPAGALFRKGDNWAVFAVRDSRARSGIINVGKRNSRCAEILSGLTQGDEIVLHPSDRISDGVAVAEQEVK